MLGECCAACSQFMLCWQFQQDPSNSQSCNKTDTALVQSANTCISVNSNPTSVKMPSTPQMRKANEKNAKNVTKRGNVVKSSKTDDKYPVSPELIVSTLSSALHPICDKIFLLSGSLCVRGHRLRSFPDYPVSLGRIPVENLQMFLQYDDVQNQQSSSVWSYFSVASLS